MWRRDYSKYQVIQDYIATHAGEKKLKEFETRLEKADPFIYQVYDLKFNKKLSFDKISETLDGMDNRRIVDYLIGMRYRDYDRRYGRRDYDNYGARQRDSRGRYMTGREDRGYGIIDDMNDMYEDYSGNKEEYNRGNYGAKDDTLKSLDYMLKSVVQFMEMLRDEATTDEEMQLIKKYARKISEM